MPTARRIESFILHLRYLSNSNYFSEGLTHEFLFSLPYKSPDEGTFAIDTTELLEPSKVIQRSESSVICVGF